MGDSKDSWHQQGPPKSKRDKKKDKTIECRCGKKYKVESAFNTHMKTCHPYQKSEQYRITEQRPPRGRPRFDERRQESSEVPNLNPVRSLSSKREDGEFSVERIRAIYQREPVYGMLRRFLEDRGLQRGKEIREDQIYEIKMGGGLAILIQELRENIQDKVLVEEFVLMLTLYVSNIIEETEDQSVLENATATLLPQYINYFLVQEFQAKVEKLGIEKMWIGNMPNAIQFFNSVFQWLKFKRYYRGKIVANKDYGVEGSDESSSSSQAV